MKGFSRFPALAGAAVALGLLGGPARAEFLTQTTATVNARGDAPGSVAGSDVTLTATYAPAPGAPAMPDITYTWTLSFAHDGAAPAPGGAPSYNLTTRVDGDASLGLQVPTTGGFDEPVIGFFALGPTLFFQLAGGVTPAGTIDTSAPYHIGVEVDTATSTIDIVTVPTNRDLGPVTVAGDFPAVPEPATLVLTGLGGGLLLLVPRLRRRLRRER